MKEKKKCSLAMIGNTHIDPVWLWSRREGMQEVKSSFASALARLEEFPDFVFSQSSVAYLAWMKETCPELFQQIQRRVAEGRWQICGGMWIEPDCDLPSGESLIRHFLYSREFLVKHFDRLPETVYSVDSFGHSSALPGIFSGAGMKYYLISRPGREVLDIPPVFIWQGPDKSTVVTEMTGGEYMAWTKPAIRFNLEESLKALEKYDQSKMAVFYGVGNHGGGPTIENIHSIYELMKEEPDLDIHFSGIEQFFSQNAWQNLPVVQGELGRIFYGCYSSDNEIKRLHRRCEWSLIKTEALLAMAKYWRGESSSSGSATKLEEAWKLLLFNQFHDILAGTCIEKARNEAVSDFHRVLSLSGELIDQAVQGIANQLDTRGEGFPLLLINASGQDFTGLVFADVYVPRSQYKGLRLKDEQSNEIPFAESNYQFYTPESRKGILFQATVPAYGYSLYRFTHEGSQKEAPESGFQVKENTITTPQSSIRFNSQTGCPQQLLYGKREFLAAPISVAAYEDQRGAWGKALWTKRAGKPFICKSQALLESNFLRTIYRSELALSNSQLVLDFIIEANSPRIIIKGKLHNAEKHCQIAFRLPLAGEKLSCHSETAFYMEDKIQNDGTEYYHHRFADFVDAEGRGMAIFNNSAYGMRWEGDSALLILSRSTVFAQGEAEIFQPSPQDSYMDQGCWEFELRLYPHDKAMSARSLFAEADQLHMPIEILQDSCHLGKIWQRQGQVAKVEGEHLIPSALKTALVSEETFVLRCFADNHFGEGQLYLGEKKHKVAFKAHELVTVGFSKDGSGALNLVEIPVAPADELTDKKANNIRGKGANHAI